MSATELGTQLTLPARVVAVLLSLLVSGSTASATAVGPGSSSLIAVNPVGWFESTTSLEVYRVSTPLVAGTYNVSSFSFHNVTQSAGIGPQAVVPFLAVLTNPGNPNDPLPNFELERSYQTIWVGPAISVGVVETFNDPANLITANYSTGTQQFSLPAGAEVHAGFYNLGTARIAYFAWAPSSGFGRTDHDTAFTPPTGASQSIAQISDRYKARYYAFQIDVELSTGLPPVPGDVNGDNQVNGSDFVVWQNNYPAASGKTLTTGDADGDGDVDGADFIVWQTNLPAGSPSSSPVPEPPALILSLIACLVSLPRFRRS
jgi:hypothetical protein